MRMKISSILRGVAVAVAVAVVGACSIEPTDLPLPGTYVAGDSYRLEIDFASVLNIPGKARVIVGGVESGVLEGVRLVDDHARATVQIRTEVQVPKGTRAELRQSTILGDIYIALLPGDGEGASLRDGDLIDLAHTAPPDNVESIMTSVAGLIDGGVITKIQSSVTDLNQAFPQDPKELQRILASGTETLGYLSGNTAAIDKILQNTTEVTAQVLAHKASLQNLFDNGSARLGGLASIMLSVVDLVIQIGYLTKPVGDLLVPVRGDLRDILATVDPWLISVAESDRMIPADIAKADELLRDKLIPWLNGGHGVNVVSVQSDSGSEEQADDVIGLLRAIGLL